MQSYFGEDTVNLYSTSLRKVALLVGAGAVAAAGMTGTERRGTGSGI
jgi:hypothetical protein